MAFRKDNNTNKPKSFTKIAIGLASPEEILEHSSGQVLKPETINYRTYKPCLLYTSGNLKFTIEDLK